MSCRRRHGRTWRLMTIPREAERVVVSTIWLLTATTFNNYAARGLKSGHVRSCDRQRVLSLESLLPFYDVEWCFTTVRCGRHWRLRSLVRERAYNALHDRTTRRAGGRSVGTVADQRDDRQPADRMRSVTASDYSTSTLPKTFGRTVRKVLLVLFNVAIIYTPSQCIM